MKKSIVNKRRIALIVILAAVFVVSAVRFAIEQLEYMEGDRLYSEAHQEFLRAPDSPADPEASGSSGNSAENSSVGASGMAFTPDQGVDFEKLRQVNNDIVGWIWIPGTVVNYPLLHCDNNETYLNVGYNGSRSSLGSIFIEAQNSPDLGDPHTIIYGHNMKNGSMFGGLSSYKDTGYAEQHNRIYIYLESGTYSYTVFSAYTTSSGSRTYTIGFPDSQSLETYFNEISASSVSIKPIRSFAAEDRIVTLSTCTSTSKTDRIVIHGLLDEYSPNTQDVAADGDVPPDSEITD